MGNPSDSASGGTSDQTTAMPDRTLAILDALRGANPGHGASDVSTLLGRLGQAAELNGAWLFRCKHDPDEIYATGVCGWSRGEPPAPSPRYRDLPLQRSGFGTLVEPLTRGEPVSGQLDHLPLPEQQLLAPRGSASFLVLPVAPQERWSGALWMDMSAERAISPVELAALRAAATTLGVVMNRQRERRQASRSEQEKHALQARHQRDLSSVSQQLAPPLRSLQRLGSALQDAPLSPEHQRLAQALESSAGHLARVVTDLPALTDARPLPPIVLDPREILQSTLDAYQALAREQDTSLDAPSLLAQPLVQADPTRLRQLLLNLVGHALQDSPGGQVSVSYRPLGERVQFRVQDSGTPEHQDLDSPELPLLLQVSRDLAVAMGGSLRQEHRAGYGNTLVLDLPRGHRPGQLPTSGPPQLDLRVLVAEDNKVNQLITQARLEAMGCEVQMVDNGAQVLDAIHHIRPDMVLMDCQMPVMDGYEATRRLRSLGYHLPIIAVTAHSFPEDRRRVHDSGMNDHLSKPFTLEQLKDTLLRHVEPASD